MHVKYHLNYNSRKKKKTIFLRASKSCPYEFKALIYEPFLPYFQSATQQKIYDFFYKIFALSYTHSIIQYRQSKFIFLSLAYPDGCFDAILRQRDWCPFYDFSSALKKKKASALAHPCALRIHHTPRATNVYISRSSWCEIVLYFGWIIYRSSSFRSPIGETCFSPKLLVVAAIAITNHTRT